MRRRLQRAGALLCGVLIALAIAGVPVAGAAAGDLVTSFGTGGVYVAPFMTTFPGAEDSHSVATDSLGRVYLSATEEPQLNGGASRKVKVVRLSSQGVLDTSFGTGGTATLPTTGDVRNAGMVIDAQDRPIILTSNGETSAYRIGLTRLTTTGQPDTDFDADGVVSSPLPGTTGNPWPAGIALDSGGGILVVGTVITSVKASGFVARFGTGGAIDGGYGTGGWAAVSDSGTEMAAIHAPAGGGAVVAGYDDYAEWVVARLTPGGALDSGFDGDGLARTSLGKGTLDLVSSYGVTVDSQGRPVVVGQFTGGGNGSLAVARWTTAGAPDASFGTGTPAIGAKLLPSVGGRGVDAAGQADGKLLVTAIGSRPDLSGNRVVLARLDENGGLDPQFAASSATPGVASLAIGQNNTPSDLLLTSAGAYIAGFRRANDNMVFTDYPLVTLIAADGTVGPPPPPPPAPPAPPPPAPVPPPVAPAVQPPALTEPKAAPLPYIARYIAFPSTKKCVSRRKFSIRLRVPSKAGVREAVVRVNGKRIAVRRGSRLRSTVDLRNLPKGRFRVEITLKLKDGRSAKDTRRYRTCTPKRRASRR